MSEWQQSSERAELERLAEQHAEWADSAGFPGTSSVAYAIDKALALADRAAEAERLLVEAESIVIGLAEWSRNWPKDTTLSTSKQDAMHSKLYALEDSAKAYQEYRAAHRNAAQQEGQGDGD